MTEEFSSNFRFVDRLNGAQIDQLLNLYEQAWWSHNRTREGTLTAITNSTLVLGVASKENELVGFARVVSDLIYRAVIFDLIVLESFRGQGIAKELVNAIIDHDMLSEVEYLDMYSNSEMLTYYESLGFKNMDGTIKLMRYDHLKSNTE